MIQIASSDVNPEAHSVFRLHHPDGDLALKLDLDGVETGRPAREFKALTRLTPYFGKIADASVVVPVWSDPDQIGLITKFVLGPTALQSATDDPSPENLALLGADGAKFLNVLHSAEPSEDVGYWPDWVIRRLSTMSSKTGTRSPQIGVAECNRLIQRYRQISNAQRGTPCLKTLAHGDFHGGNLIVSDLGATGLDMTEICRKLGLYDVVDYLTSLDIQRRDGDGQMTDLGLHPVLDDAFMQTYRYPLPREVLRCAMLGKWLILTFKITHARHAASRLQRAKLTQLCARIAHMT